MKYNNWVYPSPFILNTPRKLFTLSTLLYLVATLSMIVIFFILPFEDINESSKHSLHIKLSDSVYIAESDSTLPTNITTYNRIKLFDLNKSFEGHIENLKNHENKSIIYFKLFDSIKLNHSKYDFTWIEDTTRKTTLFKKLIR